MLLRLLGSFSKMAFWMEQRDKEENRDKSWHSRGDEHTKRTKRWGSLAYQTKPGSWHSLAKAQPRWCSSDTSLCQLCRPRDPSRGRLWAWTIKSHNRNLWRVSGWDDINSQKPSIRRENGLRPTERTYIFFKRSNIQCITKQCQKSNYPRGGCHEKSYFSLLLQYILRSSAACQVANKGRILHSWDHVARAIRLMGFGLNSRPTPLRTNAGFFQMSVSTVPWVENYLIARKRVQWF